MPTEWDYIVDDNNALLEEAGGRYPPQRDPETVALARYYRLTAGALVATAGRGTLSPRMRLPDGLGYRPRARVRLTVPEANQVFARRYAQGAPRIGVLLGSTSGPHKHPEVSSWVKILAAIREAWPTVRFYVTGARRPAGGRTYTAGYSDQAVDELLASGPDIVDCYDIGVWNQVALLQRCDVLVAPNAGFSLLAPCVGTPLLTIAGGDEVEFFFNGVPFAVVLPDTPGFPYPTQPYIGSRIPCMRPENLDRKIPEIVESLGLLLDPAFSYSAAVDRYAEHIRRANIRRSSVYLPSHPLLADF
ncbi:hypothetical protein [Actinophytocola sp.]|uniref:hypothetical protein n=1 Tax=Actinophytocola sp. TaxID=1872138 RepID=UPI002D7FA585|nr:hypothetical protein [Actinophytocola sp.]HET9139956.1 hypothetical protein [Actinophytocola sp.]